jgi:hypothetical protein
VFDDFEPFYNVKARHSTVSDLSPIAFEEQAAPAEASVRETGSSPTWRNASGPTQRLSGWLQNRFASRTVTVRGIP